MLSAHQLGVVEVVFRVRIKPSTLSKGQACLTHPCIWSRIVIAALQDSVKLAQALQDAGGAGAATAKIAEKLRESERELAAGAVLVTV